jgi:aminoglycoside phosphotransferase family enzyme/predicted kinase
MHAASGLPPNLSGLLERAAYPHPVDKVELVETHISWVLLAGEFAYKIKRPVRYAFVDLREVERRRYFCEEELRLNRRFAPELYLDVCAIVTHDGRARIGSPGETLEHAVRMRRFDRAEELDRLLDSHRIDPGELEAFGRHLALIHERLPAATAGTPWGEPHEIETLVLRNLIEAGDAASIFAAQAEVLSLRDGLQARLDAARPWMSARRANGRIRECHGDLHARNIVRMGTLPVAFDCMEFEPAFRWIDVADELAFLSSDLIARDRSVHAHAFRAGYLAQSGDYYACRMLPLYQAHRALVRAKVAALAARAGEATARAELAEEHSRLVHWAGEFLIGRRPVMLLMCGLSGSGKTWLARLLAVRLNAVHLRSDVERKRRAGLEPGAQTSSGLASGLYSREASAAVHADLARYAEDVLTGGLAVIVDATFLHREERARFRALAARLGLELHVVHCQVPEAILRARLAARRRSGHDASEADESVLEWQLRSLEPIAPAEALDTIEADTTDPRISEKLLRRLGAVRP